MLSVKVVKKGLVNELVEPVRPIARARPIAPHFVDIPAPLFAQAKRQIRQSSHERDPVTFENFPAGFAHLWADPATHTAIRAYAEQTFKQP
jgi:hypothetical protein